MQNVVSEMTYIVSGGALNSTRSISGTKMNFSNNFHNFVT